MIEMRGRGVGSGAARWAARRWLWVVGAVVAVAAVAPHVARAGDPVTKVYLNGVASPVFFNDGDSYRVLAGKFRGTKARLEGFNTLESFGPVHKWGDWDFHELYVIAKLGAYNGRRGVWHCESDLSQDTYGRTLWWCPDLVVDSVRKGLAHAMSVKGPARPEVIAAQQEAIKAKRGMWAHGVPDFILTSTHSTTEGGGRDGLTYNRLVSTKDGHSLKWLHENAYKECEVVCHHVLEPTPELVAKVLAKVKSDPSIASIVEQYNDEELTKLVTSFIHYEAVGWMKDKAHLLPFTRALVGYRKAGLIPVGKVGSCMIYTDFRRRFGGGKAECLK